MWVTYFKHRSVHNYITVAGGRDGVEIKSMIDLVMVKRDMLRYVQDVRCSERNGTQPLKTLCCTV